MRWAHLLACLRPFSAQPRRVPAVRFRPCLELLENRQLLSHFLVVLPTDQGLSATGQKVSATSGDLRYCIEQADAAHGGRRDTITFSSRVFAVPLTIALNSTLVLDDSRPLTIKGPAGSTITLSGQNAVEVLDITSSTVAISNLDIAHGTADQGGGISNQGTLTLTNCILDHNLAGSSATGGGGIFNGAGATATLANCTLNHNTAGSGGGIYNDGSVTLTACTLSNNGASNLNGGGGGIANFGTATLSTCTISDNSNSAIESNTGGRGGGIFNQGTLLIRDSTLSGNSARDSGGICSIGGTLTLANCTLTNNATNDGDAGALFLSDTSATLINCTLANNYASGSGGALFLNGGTVTLINCTISNNAAEGTGGGIRSNPTLNLTNTIVAENRARTDPDIAGAVTTADHDLIGNDTGTSFPNGGGGGSILGTGSNPIDPRLGPLQNNGGPTQTMALLPGSVAIGQADDAVAPRTDQRGVVRVHKRGAPTDIGAYES